MPDLRVVNIVEGKQLQKHPDIEMEIDERGHYSAGPIFYSERFVVAQDTLRGLLTNIGTNFLAPSFGTIISTLVNSRNVSSISEILVQQVQAVLGYAAQFRADDDVSEQIVEIVDMQIQPASREISVILRLRTGAGEVVTVTS